MTDSPISRDNADWPALKRWLMVEIVKAQRELEDCTPAPEQTHNVTRGRIAAYRKLLGTVEPKPLLSNEDVEDAPLDDNVNY